MGLRTSWQAAAPQTWSFPLAQPRFFWIGASVSADTVSAGAHLVEGGLTVNDGIGVTIAQEGQVLTAQVSGAESDDALSYAWIANGVTLGTGASYTVQTGDEGSVITLMVTDVADNGGGSASGWASVQIDAGRTVRQRVQRRSRQARPPWLVW